MAAMMQTYEWARWWLLIMVIMIMIKMIMVVYGDHDPRLRWWCLIMIIMVQDYDDDGWSFPLRWLPWSKPAEVIIALTMIYDRNENNLVSNQET